MKKEQILNSIGRSFNQIGFQLKKHSPEILVMAGVAGTVVSAVMACKETTKISEILNQTKEDVEQIHAATANEELADKYSEDIAKKDLVLVYAQTGVKLAQLYAPSIILGSLSITSILASNNILRKRNVALAAAYATIDTSFKEYRSRVVERFGKDVDHELKCNIVNKEVVETVVDENGKEKKVKKTIQVAGEPSDYARYFDHNSAYYEENPEYNLMFLKAEQNYANDRLKATGRLFLNEVYRRLGIPETKAGQVVGWVYDPNNEDVDNFVDFGIYDVNRETVRDFVNGYEPTILLDFNCDGNVWKNM